MRHLTATQAVLIAAALTIGLLFYVFGLPGVLGGALAVLVGAVVGWLGSLVLRTETQRGILFDMLAGAVGALAGLLLLGAPIGGGGPLEQFLAATLGAVLVVGGAGIVRGWRPSRGSIQQTEPER